MFNWLRKIAGESGDKFIKVAEPLAEEVNVLEPEIQALSQDEMRARTAEFRQELVDGTAAAREDLADKREELDAETDPDHRIVLRDEWKTLRNRLFEEEQRILGEILPEAFALVRESAVRTIGQRHFDVQLIGGVMLHQGKISEMKTGEGKTLTATLPLYLNALAGHGAHLVTVNDYLARRDCGWMGQIFHYLGLTTGVIIPEFSAVYDPEYTDERVMAHDERLMHLRPTTRREAYEADITYGTNNEFGFDYLRDNMAYSMADVVQRELYYAIVDEVDNILIDEARTPLIISSPDEEAYQHYLRFAKVAHALGPGDYEIDEKDRVVTLTEQGVDHVERSLGINHARGESLYDEVHGEMTFFLEAALKARFLFQKDDDYVVKDGEIVIVDEFTGRMMPGRRWSDGIHEAIEAKEKVIYGEQVEIQRESKTFATITFQNYFRLYQKLAGMTGTAATEQEEFFKIYYLDVAIVPTHRTMIRADYPDRIYATEASKFRAVVREIKEKHERGQPVLVGTTSVERSEYLSRLLKHDGIPHEILNAKQHEREALVIAEAGKKGAVTIATNMAGRGTDIVLGPGVIHPECIDPETGHSRCCLDCGYKCDECFKTKRMGECAEDVLCGLHIIGTERHEARRIDNQLRGRAGRQGDPGSSRFYVSTEDDIMRRFGPGADRMRAVLERFNPEDEMPIEAKVLSRMIEQAQVRVEGYHFDIRKHLVEYDDVLNRQREVIYAERRRILDASDVHGLVLARLREELRARTEDSLEELKGKKEYERDQEARLEALDALIEGIQTGRHSRDASQMPLFPVIGQIIVEDLREHPVAAPWETVRDLYLRLRRDEAPVEEAQAELAGYQTEFDAAVAETPFAREALATPPVEAPPVEAPETLAGQIEQWLRASAPAVERVAQAGLESVIKQTLAQRQQRGEDLVERTLTQYLYNEEKDERGLYLTRLYRELTQGLHLVLPATMTASRWAKMDERDVAEEVMNVFRRDAEEDNRRNEQRVLEQVGLAMNNWRATGGEWWTVGDFLNELDYYFRLPPRLASDVLVDEDEEELEDELYGLGQAFMDDRERRLGKDVMRQIERGYLLRAFDKEWVDYLTAMEDLRQGIGLRAYGQQDPLVEYRRESYHLFQRLLQRVREQTLFYIFRASQAPVLQRAPLAPQGKRVPARSLKPKEKEGGKKARRKEAQKQGGQKPAAPAQHPVGPTSLSGARPATPPSGVSHTVTQAATFGQPTLAGAGAAAEAGGTTGGAKKRRRHKKKA